MTITKKHSIFIVTILSTLLISFSESFSNPNRSNSEEIRWQDMELEVDSLPFQKKFKIPKNRDYYCRSADHAFRFFSNDIGQGNQSRCSGEDRNGLQN